MYIGSSGGDEPIEDNGVRKLLEAQASLEKQIYRCHEKPGLPPVAVGERSRQEKPANKSHEQVLVEVEPVPE